MELKYIADGRSHALGLVVCSIVVVIATFQDKTEKHLFGTRSSYSITFFTPDRLKSLEWEERHFLFKR